MPAVIRGLLRRQHVARERATFAREVRILYAARSAVSLGLANPVMRSTHEVRSKRDLISVKIFRAGTARRESSVSEILTAFFERWTDVHGPRRSRRLLPRGTGRVCYR